MIGMNKNILHVRISMRNSIMIILLVLGLGGCTQETQNKIGRGLQNWTGTNGVLDVYAGDKLVKRFIKIDKLSTGKGTDDNLPRNYRYGYGVEDQNFNLLVDKGERKVYFEVSDFSTYLFYENTQVKN
jgi:hypothetical protein